MSPFWIPWRSRPCRHTLQRTWFGCICPRIRVVHFASIQLDDRCHQLVRHRTYCIQHPFIRRGPHPIGCWSENCQGPLRLAACLGQPDLATHTCAPSSHAVFSSAHMVPPTLRLPHVAVFNLNAVPGEIRPHCEGHGLPWRASQH